MDTWDRLIDIRGDVGSGELKEISQKTYKHIRIVYGHRQQFGKAQGGGVDGGVHRVEGDNYNGVNSKKKYMESSNSCS